MKTGTGPNSMNKQNIKSRLEKLERKMAKPEIIVLTQDLNNPDLYMCSGEKLTRAQAERRFSGNDAFTVLWVSYRIEKPNQNEAQSEN